jgi:hypothetical protein
LPLNKIITLDLLNLFKTIIWDAFIKSAITDGLAAIGLSLGNPLVVPFTFLFTKMTDWFFKNYFAPAVNIETIILADNIHQKIWSDAQIKLKIIAKESGIDSEAFKKEHQVEQDKFYAAIKFRNNPLVVRIG